MAQAAELIEIGRPLIGNLKELSAQVPAENGVLITVKRASPQALAALVRSLELFGQLYSDAMAKLPQETMEQIVNLLVPKEPVSSTALKQAQMVVRAKNAVLQSGDWVKASDIADLAKFSSANPSSQPSKWKREKRIFAIRHDSIDYFPMYALDAATGYRPIAALKDVINVLEQRKDGWGIAYWFASVNSRLGGKRPQDLLANAPERVLAAAQHEVAGLTHG
jgi:hypothetical protein